MSLHCYENMNCLRILTFRSSPVFSKFQSNFGSMSSRDHKSSPCFVQCPGWAPKTINDFHHWLVMYIIEGDSPLNTKHFHIRFETLHWHCNVLHTELSTCAKRMTMFHYIHYYKSTCILRLCQDLVQAQIVAHPG